MSRNHRFTFAALTVVALALAPRPASAQISVQYQNLVPPGFSGVYQGNGISSTGKTYTVANYDLSTSQFNTYIVSNGVANPFNLPGGLGLPPSAYYAYLAGINDSGTACGWVSDYNQNNYGNFVYTGGQFITPVPVNGSNARYTGVSNSGMVAMSYTDATGLFHGTLYNTASGTFSDIPNVIAGKNTTITAIASNGVVLGEYRDINNVRHGFTYNNGSFTLLPDVPGIVNPPGASDYEFAGINANGLIYGYYEHDGSDSGFLYDGNDYTFLQYPGATNTDIGWGLSDTNQFVGTYFPTVGSPGAYLATVTSVPEPGTVALFVGVGVTGAGLLRRRKTRSS